MQTQPTGFCPGCNTRTAWAPGSRCPTCMLRRTMEENAKPNRVYVAGESSDLLGMIVALPLLIATVGWIFNDATWWENLLAVLWWPISLFIG